MKWLLAFLAMTTVAYGQNTPVVDGGENTPVVEAIEFRCWVGGLSFTEGATVRAGATVKLCSIGGAWTDTEGEASGCIRAGDFHSVGDVQKLPNSATIITCGANGTWTASTE